MLIVTLTFATGLLPVNDYDFFWHLKTGEWIWQNKSLPDKDPFSFTSLPEDSDYPYRPQTILQSYWLSQLFFYGLYSLSGFKGIIIFRALIFCIILIILYKRMEKDGVDYRLRIIFLVPYILMVQEYQKERPQLFSFIFAPLVINMLEDLKNSLSGLNSFSSSKNAFNPLKLLKLFNLFKLPLIMLLWANMHGGFIVGVAFISVYLLAGWLPVSLKKRDRIPAGFTLVCLTSIAVVFLNPNTYHTMSSFIAFYQGMLPAVTVEFLSPLKLFSELGSNWYSYWLLLLFAVLILIVRFKRFDLAELFLLIGTAIASLASMRYVFFFLAASIPVIAKHVNSLLTEYTTTFSSVLKSRALQIMQYGLLIPLIILVYISPIQNIFLKDEISNDMFPVEASLFLERNNLPGPIFNDATWGGYLIWKLYPKYKVFIDTRTLNVEVFKQYYSVLDASRRVYAGTPEWEGILKGYGINTILTPLTDRYSGEVLPLITELINDDEWALVYLDKKASIFLRRFQGTEDFIATHYFDKKAVLEDIIQRIGEKKDV